MRSCVGQTEDWSEDGFSQFEATSPAFVLKGWGVSDPNAASFTYYKYRVVQQHQLARYDGHGFVCRQWTWCRPHWLFNFEFYIHGSVHRESNLIIVQQDVTYSVYFITVGSSTCFGCWHPSSGAGTAVITASGTGQPGLLPPALVVEFQPNNESGW